MPSNDPGVTLVIPEITPDDLGEADDVARGDEMHGIDTALTVTSDTTTQSLTEQASEFGSKIDVTLRTAASNVSHDAFSTASSSTGANGPESGVTHKVTEASPSPVQDTDHFERGEARGTKHSTICHGIIPHTSSHR